MDAMDDGDTTVPPQYICEQCDGTMYPEYYRVFMGMSKKFRMS